MTNQPVRTALTLYSGGTLDLESAARRAGVSPEQFARTARGLRVPAPESSQTDHDRERVRLGAD